MLGSGGTGHQPAQQGGPAGALYNARAMKTTTAMKTATAMT